jgi:hypothetical protein
MNGGKASLQTNQLGNIYAISAMAVYVANPNFVIDLFGSESWKYGSGVGNL